MFTSGKVALTLLLTQFFSIFVESVLFFFNSETVRREVKSGKWDFQDGRSGRNAIAFRNILWRKKVRKAGGIEEFALFLLVPPCPGTAVGESKQNSKFCFNHFFKNRQKCSISGLKSFNLIKWRNNDVIIFWWTLTRGHPLSFVVTRGTRGHWCDLDWST